jgi:CRP/FNR family transcriptional regulator, cyclic AMP receptor protein
VPLTPEQLKEIDLFSGLDRRDLQSLANSFKEVSFSAGEEIVGEDKGGVGFFIIEDGVASVSVRGDERAQLKAGDHFGEIALIDEGARTATVTAATDVHCYGLTSWAFRPLVEHNPTIAWKLLRIMARRLREAQS